MQICVIDAQSQASFCCLCTYPLPVLCEYHKSDPKHQFTHDHFSHFLLPITAIEVIQSREQFAKEQVRCFGFFAAYQLIRDNAAAIDRFGEAVEAERRRAIDIVEGKFGEIRKKLAEMKAELDTKLESALEEVAEKAYGKGRVREGSIAEVIWKYCEKDNTNVTTGLFQGQVKLDAERLTHVIQASFRLTIPSLSYLDYHSVPSEEPPELVTPSSPKPLPFAPPPIPGLVFHTLCPNTICPSANHPILLSCGLGDFNVIEQAYKVICPVCGVRVQTSSDFGVYQAEWKMKGRLASGVTVDVRGRANGDEVSRWPMQTGGWVFLSAKIRPL